MTAAVTTLALTASTHADLQEYLFPGDGLEAAAVLVCQRGTGLVGQRLVVRDVLYPPYDDCARAPDALDWPFAETVTPERITSIDKMDQSIVTIHSHPVGDAFFSAVDDRNDRVLLESVAGWFEDARPHGAAVMRADGKIRARIMDAGGAFQPIETVAVVGHDIRCWKRTHSGPSREHETRLQQTFGKGTLELLKGLRVGVVGCSGTGSVIMELLTRNAVGALVLVDNDTLDSVNLNRIVNSTAVDADRGRPKTLALKDAIERIGLGTCVHTCTGTTASADVVRALVDCDVIFGCVDTAYGRYHLDCLASAYLIPYFDVGVHLDADGSGGIGSADTVAHYVHPDGSSLLSRAAYTMDQVTAEVLRRADPVAYEQRRQEGYLAEAGEDHPAVISVNMQAACMAFNDFLARVSGFRLDPNRCFATQRFRLAHGSFEYDEAPGAPHPLLEPYKATGDRSLLVQNNIVDE